MFDFFPDLLIHHHFDLQKTQKKISFPTGIAIARALKLNYVFQLEFIELGSAVKSPHLHGVHGNGIFTKFDFADFFSIDHPTQVSRQL